MGEDTRHIDYLNSLSDEYLRLLGNTITELLHHEFPLSGPSSFRDGEITKGRIYLTLKREGECAEDFTLRLNYESQYRRNELDVGYGRMSPRKESHIFLQNFSLEDLPPAYSNINSKLTNVLSEAGFGVSPSERS